MEQFKRGDYVLVRGVRYGSYDGEIGRVYGDIAHVRGEEAYAVDMGDVVIAARGKDLQVTENPKSRRIPRAEARS